MKGKKTKLKVDDNESNQSQKKDPEPSKKQSTKEIRKLVKKDSSRHVLRLPDFPNLEEELKAVEEDLN